MDKRYQAVIRRRKSMKDRKNKGQKIPRSNKKSLSFIDLPLLITPWYLLSIVFSVFHWLTPSYYPLVSFVHCFFCPSLIYAFLLPLGIFCPLFCLSVIDLRLLITPWYLLSIILSVLHWFTPSYYPLVSRGNKKASINEGQKKQWTKDTMG
jgi:hypothetical protein